MRGDALDVNDGGHLGDPEDRAIQGAGSLAEASGVSAASAASEA